MRALGQRLRDQEIVCSPSVAPRLRMSPLWIWHGSFPVTSRQSLSGQSSVIVKTPKPLVGGAPMQDTTGMNVSRKFPLTPHITKALTLIRSCEKRVSCCNRRRYIVKFVYIPCCQYRPSICPRLAGKSWFFNI